MREISLRQLADRWQGTALTLVIGGATLWLAATGRLILYIHPRYVVFTVILVVVGMILALVALAVGEDDEHGRDEHGHDESQGGARDGEHGAAGTATRARRRILGAATAVVTVVIVAALVILPPATLSSATASTRDVGASTLSLGSSGSVGGASASDASTAHYTVLDWATRLRQSSSLGDYAGRSVDVTGFVAPSPADPEHSFVVTRFVITCCAVDAQPVGLIVYDPTWQTTLAKDDWVRIRGGFAADPDGGQSPIAVVPTTVTKIRQPHDPYLY